MFSIVLSDILGDPLDMIASGPACPDSSTCENAGHIVAKYNLKLGENAKKLINIETPKKLDNVTTLINGSVRELCRAVENECTKYGYEPVMLTDQLCCQAKEAGSFLIEIMPVMFIPAGVGLMSSWLNLKPVIIPVCIITVAAIFTVMLVSGHVTQYIVKHSKNKDKF